MPVPVISVSQMRKWEGASWKAGKTADDVIDNVGRAVARRLESLAKPADKILFLAGKGNNGNDVRAARKHFRSVAASKLLDVSDPSEGLKNLQRAFASAACTWIVDGLFGIGLDRPLDAHWQKLIAAINESNIRILAVDVSSGLNAETGLPEGGAIRADVTLTVGAPKNGLLKAPEFVGRLEVLPDVGLVPCPFESQLNWTVNQDFKGLPPRRLVESNKGTYGHVAIVAGSAGYHGAAVLSGHSALRARPGLVTVLTQESVYLPVAAQFQAAMVHIWKSGGNLPKGCSAILFGSGMAAADLPEAVKNELRRLWRESDLPVVADANGLDWLEPGPTRKRAIRVVTPHPGEAGRMLGSSAAEVQADRVGALRRLSNKFGNCVVVLKGHQTLVGSATGKIFVNNTGNPWLAQGGSGDLLGGFLAGLLAQKQWQADALRTARYAVWEHGAAADRLAETSANWTVEDLSRTLGDVPA